ncbi:hypothetical protein K1X76_07695 [bacterium]|nr:hypothetical protein [bacterium]
MTTKKPKRKQTFGVDDAHRFAGIVAEHFKSDMRIVMEGLEGLRSEMHRKFDEAKAANNLRFDNIELTLKYHSTKFIEIEHRFERIDKRFEYIEKRFETRFNDIEHRFDKVDHTMARIAAKVDTHDVAIDELKTRL